MSKQITAKQMAEYLNECEYGAEGSDQLWKQAKENNLVIVFGDCDDLMKFRGAINEEMGVSDGRIVYITEIGIHKCGSIECPYFTEWPSLVNSLKDAHKITVRRTPFLDDETSNFWRYETAIPHETFDVLEDGEKYCRGIVFSMEDISDGKKSFEEALDDLIKAFPSMSMDDMLTEFMMKKWVISKKQDIDNAKESNRPLQADQAHESVQSDR